MAETILQHWVLTEFIYPFFFVFFVLYAIFEKTKLLGGNKQVNAIVSMIVALIFVTAVFPKVFVGNLLLFLTLAIVVVLATLMIWGFATGSSLESKIFEGNFKWAILGITVIAVFFAVLWAADVQGTFFDLLFRQTWSENLWTNVAFIVVIAVALAVAIKGAGAAKG
jgi:hypothetical protein